MRCKFGRKNTRFFLEVYQEAKCGAYVHPWTYIMTFGQIERDKWRSMLEASQGGLQWPREKQAGGSEFS